jgi:hypothetical protein
VVGDVTRSASGVILDSLPRKEDRFTAAGNHPHDHAGIDAERGRALGGVDHAEPAAGAGPEIEQTPAPLE